MTSFYAQLPRRPHKKLPRSVTPVIDANSEARFTAPPLDLSFKHIGTLTMDLSEWAEEPRNNSKSLRKTDEGKYACVSLKLNNNLIQDWNGFEGFVTSLISDAQELTWLDLSFNYLVNVDDVILKFPNLKILYLHGNGVEDLKEVEKLACLPKLMSLTLHGNPVDSERGYRHYVLTKIPQLRALDFSRVTKAERETAQTMVNFLGYGKKKEKKRRRPKTF
ncbi:leucine-rich repeat-containing protein 51-like [Patiria miniata]|uniref:Leucine-rich repeat-containing protein 51 n=1 Tax=Patiria miniata TaxID=46514 RepID=A0A913ZJB5_PATMI|nr:leucine-rich repeat-containing protein 51-like [Patiria miniata]